jgi:hypothetical protein
MIHLGCHDRQQDRCEALVKVSNELSENAARLPTRTERQPLAEHGFERVEHGVGTQHEDAFELFSSSTLYASIAKC